MVPRYFKLFWAWADLSPIFVSKTDMYVSPFANYKSKQTDKSF